MLTSKLKVLITVGTFLSIAGLVLLVFNVELGIGVSDQLVISRGGADKDLHFMLIGKYSNTFLAGGSILFGVGLMTVLLANYKLIKIEN